MHFSIYVIENTVENSVNFEGFLSGLTVYGSLTESVAEIWYVVRPFLAVVLSPFKDWWSKDPDVLLLRSVIVYLATMAGSQKVYKVTEIISKQTIKSGCVHHLIASFNPEVQSCIDFNHKRNKR